MFLMFLVNSLDALRWRALRPCVTPRGWGGGGGGQWSVSRCSAVPMGTASAPIYNKSSVTWIEGVPCSHTDDHSLGVKRAEEKHVRTSVLYNSNSAVRLARAKTSRSQTRWVERYAVAPKANSELEDFFTLKSHFFMDYWFKYLD